MLFSPEQCEKNIYHPLWNICSQQMIGRNLIITSTFLDFSWISYNDVLKKATMSDDVINKEHKRGKRYQRSSQTHKSKINWQRYGKNEKRQTNNSTQETTKNTKDWATRTPPTTGSDFMCTGRVGRSCSIYGTRRIAHLITIPIFSLIR